MIRQTFFVRLLTSFAVRKNQLNLIDGMFFAVSLVLAIVLRKV